MNHLQLIKHVAIYRVDISKEELIMLMMIKISREGQRLIPIQLNYHEEE